jgi:tetratricopeptide (TPR) repeat protein
MVSLAADPVDRARERFAVHDYSGAVAVLEAATDGGGCRYADAYNLLGLSLALLDRPDDALRAFDRALERNPRYVEAHLNRGVLLNGIGRTAEAAAAFALADQYGAPDQTGLPARAANRIANAHALLADEYRSAGALPEAIAEYRRALELRSGYVDIRMSLARTLLEAVQYADAADALDHVLAAQPFLVDALLLRGLAAYFQGAVGTASAMWDRAAELNPGDERLEVYRSMMQQHGTEQSTSGGSALPSAASAPARSPSPAPSPGGGP